MKILKKILKRICCGTTLDNSALYENLDELRQEVVSMRGAVDSIKVWMDAYHKEMLEKKHLIDAYNLALVEHQKVFPKYRNIHHDKSLVLFACGPTLDAYDLRLDAVHIGVNRAFRAGKAELDYIFSQDYHTATLDGIIEYGSGRCRKFFGSHYCAPPIPYSTLALCGGERYYFIDQNPGSLWPYPPDISVLPFATYGSVTQVAATFALYTGINKLYIVGCDTTMVGHSITTGYSASESRAEVSVNLELDGWRKFKTYAEQFYPNCEVISINPVGLKGLFKDVYTKSYLAAHPEIKDATVLP